MTRVSRQEHSNRFEKRRLPRIVPTNNKIDLSCIMNSQLTNATKSLDLKLVQHLEILHPRQL